MHWDDLRLLLAVARSETLSAAAPALKMDPSTLTRRIRRLEQDLGGAVFVKSPQGYQLTDLGRHVADQAALAEAAIREIEGEVGQADALRGPVRIGAPDGLATFVLPQVCAALHAKHPGLELQILALPRVVNLSKREADLAITVSKPDVKSLVADPICAYHLHLATRDAQPETLEAALKRGPVVGYIPDMIFDRELDYLGELGQPQVHLASNAAGVQVQALRQSGIGIVHDFALPTAPELRRVFTDKVKFERHYYLVRHHSDRGSERLDRLAAALKAGIAEEIHRLEALAA